MNNYILPIDGAGPCPGCGNKEHLHVQLRMITYWNKSTSARITCRCGWEGPEKRDAIEAVKAWNKRFGVNSEVEAK